MNPTPDYQSQLTDAVTSNGTIVLGVTVAVGVLLIARKLLKKVL